MSLRLGKDLGNFAVHVLAPAQAPGQKALVDILDVTVETAVEPIRVTVKMPAYDLAAFKKVLEVHVVLIPPGQPVPADAWAFLAAGYPMAQVDTSAMQAGESFDVLIAGYPRTGESGRGQIVIRDED